MGSLVEHVLRIEDSQQMLNDVRCHGQIALIESLKLCFLIECFRDVYVVRSEGKTRWTLSCDRGLQEKRT